MADLQEHAANFAKTLTQLVQRVIGPEVEFTAVSYEESEEQVRIGPAPFSQGRFATIPLLRACDSPDEPAPLTLKAEFNVSMDSDNHYLAVDTSVFGLWVGVLKGRSARPVFRVEFDRGQLAVDNLRPAAHVHLHAESAEMAWVYGSAGMKMRRLEEIHFPIGGRRFRPTLEDVLLFLDTEKLYTEWLPDWKDAIRESLESWNERQARATARRYPQAVASQLERNGYLVTPPVGGSE